MEILVSNIYVKEEGTSYFDFNDDGKISKEDKKLNELADELGVAPSSLSDLADKDKKWIEDVLKKVKSDPDFKEMMQDGSMKDDSMRSIFLNDMGGDIAQWDTFQQEYDELASAYQALGGTPPTLSGMMYQFGGDVESFKAFSDKLTSIVDAHGPAGTNNLTLEQLNFALGANFNMSDLFKLSTALDRFQEMETTHGEGNVDFNLFLVNFGGDEAAYSQYLTARTELVNAYNSGLMTEDEYNQYADKSDYPTYQDYVSAHATTAADIDTWAIASGINASNVGEFTTRMDEIEQSTVAVQGQGIADGAHYDLLDHLTLGGDYQTVLLSEDQYLDGLTNVDRDLTSVTARLELLNDIKKDITEWTKLAQDQKSTGGNTEETAEMRASREELAGKLLVFYGEGKYTPEQINAMSFDEKLSLLKSEFNIELNTNTNGGDNIHNGDEWGYNIDMMNGVANVLKDEGQTLLSYVNQLSQLQQKILAVAEQANKGLSEAANGLR